MSADLVRFVGRAGSLLAVALVAQGCGCDLVGCVNGLRVHLSVVPTGPFQVDLLVDGVIQNAPPQATCAATGTCYQDIYFQTTASERISIRVTTAAGTRVTAFAKVRYVKSRPNGRWCDPECQNATVTAEVPPTLGATRTTMDS